MSAVQCRNDEIELHASRSMHRVYKAVNKAIVIYICKRNQLARNVGEEAVVVFCNSITTGGLAADDRNTSPLGPTTLLLKEMDENNNWTRLGFQLYVGWFSLQFTVNIAAASWVFVHTGPSSPLARWVFAVLIGLNLMGTITAFYLRNHFLERNLRLEQVIKTLAQHSVTDGAYLEPQSSVPWRALNTLLVICAFAMLISLLFWITILVIWQ